MRKYWVLGWINRGELAAVIGKQTSSALGRYAIFRICEWCSDCKQYFPEVGKTKILSTEPRFRYIPLEKETENSLTPWDACVEGKTMKLTSSPSIEH